MPMPKSLISLRPASFAALLMCTACLPGSVKEKDYSDFTSYAFAQTAGLGFCGDPSSVFSAKITRTDSDEMTFAATTLRANTISLENCESRGGVYTESGCLGPVALPVRTLTAEESSRVQAMFSKVGVLANPKRECRRIAFDPCKIDEHVWDKTRHTDYICGASRLPADQSRALVQLLTALRDAGAAKP